MLACRLKLIFWFLLLSLQLSAILSKKENRGNNGIVMTLHHMKGEEGFVPMEDGSNHVDRAYQRLAKMVQASKDRASVLKRGMIRKSISGEGSLYGHSYDLEYYIKFSVGTPPQDLLLVMDTGSDVVWVPCTTNYTCNHCPEYSSVFHPRKSSSAGLVKCADPKCKDLCANYGCVGSIHNCSRACPQYTLLYGTGNTTGRLLSETLTLPLEDGGRREIKHFGVGCSVVSSVFAGIAGFGRGGLSMPSQLSPLISGRFAYCLQSHRLFDNKNKSSRMVLGDKAVPKDIRLNYTPFLHNSRAPSYNIYYYIGLTGISIGGKRLKLPSNVLRFDTNGNGGTIIDSGSSVTLFPDAVYNQIVGKLTSQIGYTRTREIEALTGYGLCYNVSGVDNIQFPEFAFHFKGGSDMVLPFENTFIAGDSHFHTYCLAMINSSVLEADLGPAVLLGNYQQQNFYILYDREKNRLGFSQKTCEAFG